MTNFFLLIIHNIFTKYENISRWTDTRIFLSEFYSFNAALIVRYIYVEQFLEGKWQS